MQMILFRLQLLTPCSINKTIEEFILDQVLLQKFSLFLYLD